MFPGPCCGTDMALTVEAILSGNSGEGPRGPAGMGVSKTTPNGSCLIIRVCFMLVYLQEKPPTAPAGLTHSLASRFPEDLGES